MANEYRSENRSGSGFTARQDCSFPCPVAPSRGGILLGFALPFFERVAGMEVWQGDQTQRTCVGGVLRGAVRAVVAERQAALKFVGGASGPNGSLFFYLIKKSAQSGSMPSAGIEPAPPPSEGGVVSIQLRGPIIFF